MDKQLEWVIEGTLVKYAESYRNRLKNIEYEQTLKTWAEEESQPVYYRKKNKENQ